MRYKACYASTELSGEPSVNPQSLLMLEPRQNFYDQPPFAAAIQTITDSFGVAKASLQCALTSIARSDWRHKPRSEFSSWILALLHGSANLGTVFRKKCSVNLKESIAFNHAVGSVLHAIVEYPYWIDYIRSCCTDDIFTFAGDQPGRSKAGLPEGFPSYAAYAADRLYSEGSTVLYGLSDIFPQQLQNKPMSRMVRETGEKRATRRYVLLKASNLILH